ncbi:MAG: aldo/keto reductase [Kiritimatiellae bacterium]|nr:aldo/keto reductase [Kiritimatiellia bacterium]
MLYRQLGNSGCWISLISFGSMRFRSEEAAHAVLTRGLDLGLNYIDTSSGYVGGKSEVWSGRAIRTRRSEIYFSSKSNWSSAPNADTVRASIERSLAATGLDYFDFYQLWGLETEDVLRAALVKGGFIEGVRRAQKEGLVKYGLGFTFHGSAELFRAAVDTGEFCCATVSYNLLNRQEEVNIAYAAQKGVGIIVMNPLAGGVLALAGDRRFDFLRAGNAGPWWGSLRFLHAHPGITTSLVGFMSAREVDDAVSTLEGVEKLDETFRADLIAKVTGIEFPKGNLCTGCGYCKECPHGFNPTKFMETMRDFVVYRVAGAQLAHWIDSKYPHQNIRENIAKCVECGECEGKCPQHLDIVSQIRRGKKVLGVPSARKEQH